MKTVFTFVLLNLLAVGGVLAAPAVPSEEECKAVRHAAMLYDRYKDTNGLAVIESFHKAYPDNGDIGIPMLKLDDVTRVMFYRLFYAVPDGAKCRKWLVHKLGRSPESDDLLQLFVDTALNKKEDEDTRLAAMSSLHDSKWSKSQAALSEIYLKSDEEKYHYLMLEIAINRKKSALAEIFLGYYRHFHPKEDERYSRHHTRLRELKTKLAEEAKNPKPDPLALARAENEWWDKFIKKERKVTLAEAKTGLANFDKAPVLERLELAYAIQQSVAPDAELVKRLAHLIPDEPSALVKMAMINTIALHQPNLQAKLQYYRRVAAQEKNPEVVRSAQHYIKLIEDGVLKR